MNNTNLAVLVVALMFNSLASAGVVKTITADSETGSVMWPTNLWSVNGQSIFTALGLWPHSTNQTSVGWRQALGLDERVTNTTSALWRMSLDLDGSPPGSLGTNLLTQTTASGARPLIGLSAGTPGDIGTNLLVQTTAANARTLIGVPAQDGGFMTNVDLYNAAMFGTHHIDSDTSYIIFDDSVGDGKYAISRQPTNYWPLLFDYVAGKFSGVTNTSPIDNAILNKATADYRYTGSGGRDLLGLSTGSPGAVGTNLLTQSTAGGTRTVIGLDVGSPGTIGTNLLTAATSADASLLAVGARNSAAIPAAGVLVRQTNGVWVGDGITAGGVMVSPSRWTYDYSTNDERMLAVNRYLGSVPLDDEPGVVHRVGTAGMAWQGITGRTVEFALPNLVTNTPLRMYYKKISGIDRYLLLTRDYWDLTNHYAGVEWSDNPRLGWTLGLTYEVTNSVGLHFNPGGGYMSQFEFIGTNGVLYAAYQDHSIPTRLFFSNDGGKHWGNDTGYWTNGSPLIVAPAAQDGGPVDHYHGVKYDEAFSTLYVMWGDITNRNGLGVCRDVWGTNGLIYNPTLWRGRWALEKVVPLTMTAGVSSYAVGNVVSNYLGGQWGGIVRKVATATNTVWVGLDYPAVYATITTANGITNVTTGATNAITAKYDIYRGDWVALQSPGYFATGPGGRQVDGTDCTYMRILSMQFLNDGWAYWSTDDTISVDGGVTLGTKLCRLHRKTGEFQHLGTYPGLSYTSALIDDGMAVFATSSYASAGAYSFGSDNYLRLIGVQSGGYKSLLASFQRTDVAYVDGEINLLVDNVGGAIVAFPEGIGFYSSYIPNLTYNGTAGSFPTGRMVPNHAYKTIMPTRSAPTEYWEGGQCANGVPSTFVTDGAYSSTGLSPTHTSNLYDASKGRDAWKLTPNGSATTCWFDYKIVNSKAKATALLGAPLALSVWVWLPATIPVGGQNVQIYMSGNNGATGPNVSNAYFKVPQTSDWWSGGWHRITLNSHRVSTLANDLRIMVYVNNGGGTAANLVPIYIADCSLVGSGLAYPDR